MKQHSVRLICNMNKKSRYVNQTFLSIQLIVLSHTGIFFCIRLYLRQPDYFCKAAAFFLPAMISIADITTIVPANSWETESLMANKPFVYSPNASRLKKFPHLPIICPVIRPNPPVSNNRNGDNPFIFANINTTTIAVITPPYMARPPSRMLMMLLI